MARRKHAIDEKTRAKDVSGNVYIITGANSGVGLETARQLMVQGGHVVLACRRVAAGTEAAQGLRGLKGTCEVLQLDLADLQSVRDFVRMFREKHTRLDGLVCNAGILNASAQAVYTKDNLEITWAVSYYGHFLLTELLLDMLVESAPSRWVILSSVGHAGSPKNRPQVHLDDLQYTKRAYSSLGAYTEAKVATNLYAMELAERLKGTGVVAFAVHPGWARSNFASDARFPINLLLNIFNPIGTLLNLSDTNVESAQTSLHCLLSDDALKHSGAYFSQWSILYQDPGTREGGWPMESPNPHARDMHVAKQLVAKSYPLVGLKPL